MEKVCPISNRCGGCANIELSYEKQLQEKYEMIQRLYPKIIVDPIVGMDCPAHYRHKVYATFGYDKKGCIIAGMYKKNSHELVYEKNCYIQHKTANMIIQTICQLAQEMHLEVYNEDTGNGVLRHIYIRISRKSRKVLLTIVIGSRELPGSKKLIRLLLQKHPEIETIILNYNSAKTNMILGSRDKVLYGKGSIIDEIDNVKFRISSKSFYQVNPEQTQKLYKCAISLAKLDKTQSVLDACCGSYVIIMTVVKSLIKSRVLVLLQNIKTLKNNNLCVV